MDTAMEADVARAMRGDEAAYARLVDRTSATVCSIALAIVRNVAASEDVAQEVYLALWRGLGKLRSPSSFLPWLRQVTRNQANEWLRANVRERSDEITIAAAVDARVPADHALLDEEQRRVVRDVLDTMPDDEREIVILYYREGSSVAHVAALLGISTDAAKQRLSRARSRLREQVLERFATIVRTAAPGAAFTAAVSGAIVGAAPSAAALAVGTTGANAAAGKFTLAAVGGVLLSGLAGVAGAVMGLKHLEPFHDAQEEADLRRFRRVIVVVIMIASAALAVAVRIQPEKPRLLALVVMASFLSTLVYLYGVRLPAILERRAAWERAHDPAVAKMRRREWISATIGHALGALFGGLGVMFLLVRLLS